MSEFVMHNKIWEWQLGDEYYVRVSIALEGLNYKAIDKRGDETVFMDSFQSISEFKDSGPRKMFTMPTDVEQQLSKLISEQIS